MGKNKKSLNEMIDSVLKASQDTHPRKKDEAMIQYGTAGFRTNAKVLDHVMFRMGVLAVLRSKLKKATIGVMITASHNPECDNGVKLVDPMGEMLAQSWEGLATKLANASESELHNVIQEIANSEGIDMTDASIVASVFVGRDTRESSPSLCQAVIDGVESAGGQCSNYGILSTPQLHFFVVCKNTGEAYGKPTEEGYFQKLGQAFLLFGNGNASNGNYSPIIKFDGANGVGAAKMGMLMNSITNPEIMGSVRSCLEAEIVNDGTKDGDVLNFGCGADFVKVQQRPPRNLENVENGVRCISVDGDADRIVYFFKDKTSSKFVLLDGDKIATLVAGFLKDLLRESGLLEQLKLGLVQTAYANGSSTKYINNTLNIPVACTATGVKHLHHRALDFDIGVYFEANGHGTVIFSSKAETAVRDAAANGKGKRLLLFMDMINQTVGDSLSDMLMVESILHERGWDVQDWSMAYQDLPNRQIKVSVADRNVIQTADEERVCVKPGGLQEAINTIVTKFKEGRSFVRPSGTEDVVRVYAEADTQANADQLAYEVGVKVHKMAGGVGDPVKMLI